MNAEVPSNATLFATGNNLTLAGDMTRRAIRATLDAGVERPELRAFDRDPVATAMQHRGDYVAAGLTILRAFHIAGRPARTVPLGSFTVWSSWVRDALIWLGEADPCETMESVRGADPRLEALTAAMEEWSRVIGTDRVTVREIIERATAQRAQMFGKPEFVHPEFRESLLRVAGEGGAINGMRLGKWLSQHQNRIIAGRRIMVEGSTGNRARWQMEIQIKDAAPIPDGSETFRRTANA